jgi:MFS transporter, ACS family, D-galactonate transporter
MNEHARPLPEALPAAQVRIDRNVGIDRDAVRRWGILGLLCLGFIAAYFDRQNLSVAVAIPEFRNYFGLSNTDRGLLTSAFYWTYCPLMILAGWLVDRYGVKRTLGVGFLLWSVASALTGLATSLTMVLVMRLLLGVGESVANPAGMRWIRFNMPEQRRGLAVGIYQASAKIGPALAVPLATWLIVAAGWRPMFMVMGLGCLIWLVPWMLLVRDDDRQIEVAQQKASGAPAVPFGRIMKSPVIWGTLIGTFAYQYFLYFTMTWMPAYFLERRKLSLASMSWYSFFTFIGMAIVAIAAGWAADRLIARGRDPVKVRRSFAIAGLLLASTELIGAFAQSNSVAIFFAVFSLTGLGLMTANYWALTQTLIPGGAVGRIVGVQNCAAQIPGIAAPIVTGWLVQRTGNYEAPMVLIGVFLALGVLAYVFLVRREYAPRA